MTHDVLMTPGEIKAWRIDHKLSQAQLARLLPVNLDTLQNWESTARRHKPPPYLPRALADVERELSARDDPVTARPDD